MRLNSPDSFELMERLGLCSFVGLLQELRLGSFVSKIILFGFAKHQLVLLLLKSVFKEQVGQLAALLYLLDFAQFFTLQKLDSYVHLARLCFSHLALMDHFIQRQPLQL